VHRWVVLLALAACDASAASSDPPERAGPAPVWLYEPGPTAFPLGAVTGQIGRGQSPQPMLELGIAGPVGKAVAPLHLATVWQIAGDGPARAVFYGMDGERAAIELVDLDAGRVAWRDTVICAAPIVAATAEVVVCADASGTRAIGLDGAARWRTASPFIAATGDRIAVSGAGESIILDAATGGERTRVALPRGVAADAVLASCGAGRELIALGDDGKLARIADAMPAVRPGTRPRVDARPAPAIAWSVAVGGGPVTVVEACAQAQVVVSVAGADGNSLIALARTTGAVAARIDGVRGWWPARDGSDRLEVATVAGLASYASDLTGPTAVEPGDVPLGELLASRGDRRLVRATPSTAVVLDRGGVRAYVPLGAMGAALGDTAIVTTSWSGAPGETLHRFALPERWERRLRVPAGRRGVALDAELRDLPPVLPLELAGAIAQADTGMYAIAGHAVDPADGAAVYAIAIDHTGQAAAVARADLVARRWRWQRVDGCAVGTPVALVVARDVVLCGSRGTPSAVRATSRDGAARWDWTGSLDGLTSGGDLAVIHDGARLTVLDARDGRVLGRVASDDGAAVRAAIVVLDPTVGAPPGDAGRGTLLVTAERGRVVARLGAGGLLPVWSVAVAGAVRSLAPSGAGVLVVLDDGDAYRIDARTAARVAVAGLGLDWHAAGELIAGATVGGPIPGPAPPPPKPTVTQLLKRPLQILRGEINTPPPMSTPITPPPPLGDSWQLTLYELGGGLRVRNDYALSAPISGLAPRGPAGSPLVVVYGPGLREAVVLDPRTGDPVRRVRLPDDALPAAVFGTVVDGSPVAGAVLASPLRVVLF
jgi:hypothetical protein